MDLNDFGTQTSEVRNNNEQRNLYRPPGYFAAEVANRPIQWKVVQAGVFEVCGTTPRSCPAGAYGCMLNQYGDVAAHGHAICKSMTSSTSPTACPPRSSTRSKTSGTSARFLNARLPAPPRLSAVRAARLGQKLGRPSGRAPHHQGGPRRRLLRASRLSDAGHGALPQDRAGPAGRLPVRGHRRHHRDSRRQRAVAMARRLAPDQQGHQHRHDELSRTARPPHRVAAAPLRPHHQDRVADRVDPRGLLPQEAARPGRRMASSLTGSD